MQGEFKTASCFRIFEKSGILIAKVQNGQGNKNQLLKRSIQDKINFYSDKIFLTYSCHNLTKQIYLIRGQ